MSDTNSSHGEACGKLQITLESLKDFQRATVSRIVQLFDDPEHSHRILVADEVGLGKTVVAKGVIASLLLKWRESRPFRVAYICSNLGLANENRNKLAVFKDKADLAKWVREPSFSRLAEVALLPKKDNQKAALLEICSLTPGTSFTLTFGVGNRRERAIIFTALMLHPVIKPLRERLNNVFRQNVQNNWEVDISNVESYEFNMDIVRDFHQKLHLPLAGAEQTPLDILNEIATQSGRAYSAIHHSILRDLRQLFTASCAAHLQADLFILDEFQRFESLLDPSVENEQAVIAQQVFAKTQGQKILLLSATPFRAMSTIAEDEKDDGHLTKLQKILEFLNLSPLYDYEPARKLLQSELLRLGFNETRVEELQEAPRQAVERLLRPLISRTERSQIAKDVDGLIRDLPLECTTELCADDIRSFIELDQLGLLLQKNGAHGVSRQILDFYKSAAWPLSFSTGYSLQETLKKQLEKNTDVTSQLRKSKNLWLPTKKIKNFELNLAKDAPNPKVRALVKHLFGDSKRSGTEMLLWMPPSRPHYPLSGYFAGHENFTKSLLFSAWAMVPRMLSGLLSYESERRVLGRRRGPENYFSQTANSGPDSMGQLIKLDKGDLANWSLLYPAKVLIDFPPENGKASLEQIINTRTEYFQNLLAPLKGNHEGGRNRNHWYLFAPMLLDQRSAPGMYQQWIEQMKSIPKLSEGMCSRLDEIEGKFGRLDELGEMPDDLPDYLARLSVGSPAVCAYRALMQYYPEENAGNHAGRLALAFISLFNSVTGSAVVRRMRNKQHWRSVVDYCAQGGIEAMLEEYFYMLFPASKSIDDMVKIVESVLRPSHSNVKVWKPGKRENNINLRCHYSVPLGTQKSSDEAGQVRVINIREGFNSPFRPFILTSTSIGQEGLDFHWYCSEVIHWNLPNNPIDLEQREGRVNRYQSLVIRRRLVQAMSKQTEKPASWFAMFAQAEKKSTQTDLVPYWHYPEGDAQINRVVPRLELSYEHQRYPQMLKILSLYRLAFGQPGQSELLEHLRKLKLGNEALETLKNRLMIQLAPVLYASEIQTEQETEQ